MEESVPEGVDRRATVYDVSGDPERLVRWPSTVNLGSAGWIDEEAALGIETDSLGVQRVIRLRFKPED